MEREGEMESEREKAWRRGEDHKRDDEWSGEEHKRGAGRAWATGGRRPADDRTVGPSGGGPPFPKTLQA